jgi:hypothetical protein
LYDARRQKLQKEFENLAFKNGEALEDFSLRVSSIVSELQLLGDDIDELKAVQKFLCLCGSRVVRADGVLDRNPVGPQ